MTASAALAAGATLPRQSFAQDTGWKALAEDVKAEMVWAWDNYRQFAWGKDELKPASGGYRSFPLKNGHLGLSLVEALDTLWVMGLDSQFAEGLDWVKRELDFAVDGEVSVFETSIRLLGGLLSAHHASGDPAVLAKAKDLGDRLLPAFSTPTGMPLRYVNLRTGASRDSKSSPAEVATYLPEWGTLSRLTGDRRYADAARRAMHALFDRRSELGLFATGIDTVSGQWRSRKATIGSYVDSSYEYLWDSWQLLGDEEAKRMYESCVSAILEHQQVWQDGALWFANVDFETGKVLDSEQDSLAAFFGGLLGQGGAMREGAAYTESWAGVLDRFGTLPEVYDYKARKARRPANWLVPELADAAFNLWLLDRQDRWRQIIRTHYLNMKRWQKTRYGYTQLSNVTSKRQTDRCPGYWWSEQMKYYYLAFSDTARFDYGRNYLSTEGNVLLGFRRE
ncbi:MAG: glycoside hydrolase family 47 protein [Novosphingobium sp.]